MTATEIAKRLAARSDQAAAHLLPGGERQGREWLAGSTAGEQGSSLHVILEGDRAGVWRDFAGSDADKGDLIGLWMAARNVDLSTACREALDWLQVPEHERNSNRVPPQIYKSSEPKEPDARWLEIQSKMRAPTNAELEHIAAQRKIPNTAGLQIASRQGHLFVADVFDASAPHKAWLLTDSSRRNAQARKMDGSLWTFNGKRKAAKTKTIWGTDTTWPIGAPEISHDYVVFCEGGPDLLAAYHMIWRTGFLASPVAIFGASNYINPDAVRYFADKSIHFFPHIDSEHQGEHAAARWATQLDGVAKEVEFFRFQRPAADLNDYVTAEEVACHE